MVSKTTFWQKMRLFNAKKLILEVMMHDGRIIKNDNDIGIFKKFSVDFDTLLNR